MKRSSLPARKITGRAAVKSRVTDETLVATRREQIVAAATDLFASQGCDRATIRDAARKAGLSAGLIDQYARTKEDVLFLPLASVLESCRLETPQFSGPVDGSIVALRQSVEACLRLIDRRRRRSACRRKTTAALVAPLSPNRNLCSRAIDG